jgi:hypothetical protein
MMSQPSERAAVAATIDPQTAGASQTKNSDWVDMSKFREAMAIALVGNIDRTVDALIQEAKDSSGTGAQTLSGKSATQLSGTDDNKQVVFNIKSDELSTDYRFIRLQMTTGAGGTTDDICGVILGMKPIYGPASDDDLSSVAQIVT